MWFISPALLCVSLLSIYVPDVTGFYLASMMQRLPHTSKKTFSRGILSVLNFINDENSVLLDDNEIYHSTSGVYIRPAKKNEIASVVSLRVNVFYPELKNVPTFHTRIYEKLCNRIVKRGSICLVAFRDEECSTEHGKACGSTPFSNILGTIEVSGGDFLGTAMESVGSQRKLYCCDLAVQENARRNGLATKLLHAVESYAVSEEYDELYLHVEKGNTAAEALYLGEGYQEIPSLSWALDFTQAHLQKSADHFHFLWKKIQRTNEVKTLYDIGTAKDDAEHEKPLYPAILSAGQPGVITLD